MAVVKDETIVITEFVRNPHDRSTFFAFFELTFHLSRAYLNRLKNLGWRLPLDQFAEGSAIDDCTLDLLGSLYRSDNGRPYYVILDYLEDVRAENQLRDRLRGLVAGHIHQELDRLRKVQESAASQIKRQVEYALSRDGFEEISFRNLRCWRRARGTSRDRDHCPFADYDQLQRWVVESVRVSSEMPKRIAYVFAALNDDERYAACLPHYVIVSAFREVLLDHTDQFPPALALPKAAFLGREFRRLTERAIHQSLSECLERQGQKRGLTETERDGYKRALTRLMDDYLAHADHDALPKYLYEQLPNLDSPTYLSRHKYAWETVTADCKDRFAEQVRGAGLERTIGLRGDS